MVKEAIPPISAQASSADQPKPGVHPSGNLAVKCIKCKELLYGRDWEKNLKVCPRCNYHFKLTAQERIDLLADPGSFVEIDDDIISVDPLHFVSRSEVYAARLDDERRNAGMNEAKVMGPAAIQD